MVVTTAPQDTPRPAGAGTYAAAWTVPLSAGGALSLTFAPAGLVVAGPGIPTELRAIDDGRVVWTASDSLEHPPIVADGLLFGTGRQRLIALDLVTGETRWRADLAGATRGPWAAAGRVLVSAGNELVAFRATDGVELWRHDAGSPPATPPTASAAAAVLAFEDRTLGAFSLEDGSPYWRTALDATPLSLLADGDRIYFGATEGYACAHRLSHGRKDWCFPVRVRPIGTPAADARYVYFSFLDNMVHVFDRRSGRRYSTPTLDALPADGPRLAANLLIVPVVTGEFVLLDPGRAFAARRVSTPRAQELPLTRAAAVSPDGALLAVVTASPGGRSLVCFSRPARTPLEEPSAAPVTPPTEAPARPRRNGGTGSGTRRAP